MARPRTYPDRDHMTIRLTPELHERLRDAADDRELSVNWMVTRAIEDFLDRLIPADELALTRRPGTDGGGRVSADLNAAIAVRACAHTEDGEAYCGEPECDIYFCEDCGNEFEDPCERHKGVPYDLG